MVSFLLSSFWTSRGLRSHSFSPLQFLSRIRFSIPTARRFSSNAANSRSPAFRESIFAQENSLRIYTTMQSVGLELMQSTTSRHEDNLLHHRGDLGSARYQVGSSICMLAPLIIPPSNQSGEQPDFYSSSESHRLHAPSCRPGTATIQT